LSFREKKQNSNRVRGVEVLSIFAWVKNLRKGNFLLKLHQWANLASRMESVHLSFSTTKRCHTIRSQYTVYISYVL
jgi:hypothetical protein